MTNTKTPNLNIFLCHAKEDKPKVREIYRRLKSDGYNVWFDEEELIAGQNWKFEIHKAMRNADVIIYCLSTVSVEKAGYVQVEYKEALEIAQEKPEGIIFIIPLKLNNCLAPASIDDLQWLNYFEDGYDGLKKSLTKRIGEKIAQEINLKKIEKEEGERTDQRKSDQSHKEINNLILKSNVSITLVIVLLVFTLLKESFPFMSSIAGIIPTNTIISIAPSSTTAVTLIPTLITGSPLATFPPSKTPTATVTLSKTQTQSPSHTPSTPTQPVSINKPPVANEQSVAISENTPIDIVLTGFDVEGDSLTYVIITPPLHGALSGTQANVTYMPVTNYTGLDSFSFVVNDGLLDSVPATIKISILAVNDPLVCSPTSRNTSEGIPLNISPSCTDVDRDDVTYIISVPPKHGTVLIEGDKFHYTPDADYTGQDRFTYRANDGIGDSNDATIFISVNRAPFDWESFGQNISNVLTLLGVIFTIVYVVGLLPFLLFFEQMVRILDRNPSVITLFVNLEFFNWLEATFRFVDIYQSNKIKRKSEPAKRMARILAELDESSDELKQAISNEETEIVNTLTKRLENLLDQYKENALIINKLLIDLRAKYDAVYQKIVFWRGS